MADEKKTDAEKMAKLSDLIKDVRIAMLTTVFEGNELHSRPMAYQHPKEGFDGTVYFFTRGSSGKVHEMEAAHNVNVSFSDPKGQDFVSISGTAQLSRDEVKMEQLWNPALKAWFPDELKDPDIALLVVDTKSAEYWDGPNSVVIHLVGVVKAAVTGTPMKGGENETIQIK